MSETLRVNRLAGPITVLGPGTRVALWVQGCTIGCAGCASVDTWDAAGGAPWLLDPLADEVVRLAAATDAAGVTVTGGEPFQQPDLVAGLISRVRERWAGSIAPDVLVFTGYASSAARRRSPMLWNAADIVIAGPYRRDRPSDHPLLGSANQTIETLTELGRQRLAEMAVGRPRLQLSADDGELSLVGMPDPGDLDRLRAALAARGIHLGDVSWDERSAG